MAKIEHIRELLSRKRAGLLDVDEKIRTEDDTLWRNTIPYKVLEESLWHVDEEIRLSTLMLLVESRKSTLKFTEPELQMIAHFLKYNFKERSEYVPVIKKALKRLKDSLIVMRRQLVQEEKAREYYKVKNKSWTESDVQLQASYQTSNTLNVDVNAYKAFFTTVKGMCVSRICPDATYHSRRSALQVLCLLNDFLSEEFDDVEWDWEEAEQVFYCLLLDTYESNKTMAYSIIKSLDVTLLNLDKENTLCVLITTAVELGNSIRPIDTITASYMLKVAMLSPIIQNVLKDNYNLNHPETTVEVVTLKLVLLLLNKLKESLRAAEENILQAVTKYSLYGYVFCLRSLLSECNLKDAARENLWRDTIAQLVSTCFALNLAVSPIVNNSSPEGHLPMDLDLRTTKNIFNSTREDDLVTPQMILLCSWRTVKEVSLLFGLLATKSPISDDHSPLELLTEDQIVKIGEHLVTLLTETKHRGAFEQAHVGFSQLCTRLWRLMRPNLKNLPKLWLHQTLIAITGLAHENSKLCATRRSAGVPFMVQALLSTEPRSRKNVKTSTFHSVMRILLGLAEFHSNVGIREKVKRLMYKDTVFSDYETLFESFKCDSDDNGATFESGKEQATEIKTHALNILRAIFRHSQLGELVNDYIADGLIAAFRSYDGMTWAERNAATLLFSALIVRIFGVQRTKDHINLTTDNKMSAKIFFERYPKLLPFILSELSKFSACVLKKGATVRSNVHPILLLLSRLYVSYGPEGLNPDWIEMTNLISRCALSPVHETRKLAARALIPLLTEETVTDTAKSLLNNVIAAQNDRMSLNLTHGYTMQILELTKLSDFAKPKLTDADWNEFLEGTEWILSSLESNNENDACFPLATVYINVLNELCKANPEMNLELDQVLRTIVQHVTQETILKEGPARENYKTSIIEFLLHIRRKPCRGREPRVSLNTLDKIYSRVLNRTDPELNLAAWTTITEIIDDPDEFHESLRARAFQEIRNTVDVLPGCSPELQDAMFDFLHHCAELGSVEVAEFVLNELRVDDDKYTDRDSYLRLLGKSYVTVKRSGAYVTAEVEEDVYERFCQSTWIATADRIRESVFKTLLEMRDFLGTEGECGHREMLWWTTVLQLLVDDNFDVRQNTFELIDRASCQDTPICYTGMLARFFDLAFHHLSPKDPATCYTLLFTWSCSLLGDNDYEMDETDVFNKCRNYEMFEPVQISNLCVRYTNMMLGQHSIDEPLPAHSTSWLTTRLGLDLSSKSVSFREAVTLYGKSVPELNGDLRNILSPTFRDRLLEALAYDKWQLVIRSP